MEFEADGNGSLNEEDELSSLKREENPNKKKYEDAATNLHCDAFLGRIKELMGDVLPDAAVKELISDEDGVFSIDWHERRQTGLDWYKKDTGGSVPRVHPDEYYNWLAGHLGSPTTLKSWAGIIRVTTGDRKLHIVYGKDGVQINRSTYLPE